MLVPLLAVLGALGVATVMLYPLLTIQPHDIPVAVVDLDEGVGGQSAGAQLVAGLQQAGADGTLAWTTLDDRAALDEALDAGEVYAGVVVSADFTAAQALAATGEGDAATLDVVVNQGKNPMVASLLTGALNQIAAQTGLQVDMQTYHPVPAALGMSATMLPMAVMLMTFISALAGAVVVHRIVPLGPSGRATAVAARLGLTAAVALVAGFGVAGVLGAAVDLDVAVADIALFVSVAVFAIGTVAVGTVGLLGTKGLAVPMSFLLLGMGTANLGPHLVPWFWEHLVYPWVPVRFVSEGARAVLFEGAGAWSASTTGLLVTALVGVLAVLASARWSLDRRSPSTATARPDPAPAPA